MLTDDDSAKIALLEAHNISFAMGGDDSLYAVNIPIQGGWQDVCIDTWSIADMKAWLKEDRIY